MATVVNFGGRRCVEPGSYATTVYTPTSVVNVAQFGNVMIIDTGVSMKQYDNLPGSPILEFAGGSGINGTLAKGGKSVYEFDSIEDFNDFMGGGELCSIAEKIFTPRSGVAGAPKLYYARAAKTTQSTAELTFDTEKLVIGTKNEGVAGNGVIQSSVLKAGYSAELQKRGLDFALVIKKGNFGGYDAAGDRINGYSWESAFGETIIDFEFGDIESLSNFLKTDPTFNAHFTVIGEIPTEMPPSSSSTYVVLFTGGNSEYRSDDVNDIMDAIEELDITFFLGTNLTVEGATEAWTNVSIFTYIKTQAKYGSILFVPAGENDDDLFGDGATSQSAAKYYNDSKVVVVHGSPEVPRLDNPRDTKKLPAVYLAAAIIGMNAGMEAQTPITFRQVGYNAFAYDLKRKEREQALQAGIMHVRNIGGNWCVNQGITSLQDNLQTYDAQGNSMELSIELIKAQVNKELMIDAENRFVGQNAAQASPESVKNFTETKLASLVAERGADNLIISWKNVKVTTKNGDYYVSYDFIPNVPLNKVFFIGNVLDFTVSA